MTSGNESKSAEGDLEDLEVKRSGGREATYNGTLVSGALIHTDHDHISDWLERMMLQRCHRNPLLALELNGQLRKVSSRESHLSRL